MNIKAFCLSFLTFIGADNLQSQEIGVPITEDSLSNCGSYQLWVDGGINYFVESESSDFEPTYNLRLGLGRQFQFFEIYGFLEFTSYDYKGHTPLSSPSESSDRRYDIAFYGMTSVFQIISLGIGIHYTHEDNVIQYDWPSSRVISQSGDRSYYGLYYLIGLGYPIKITHSISLPIGLDYRRAENNRNGLYVLDSEKTYVALRAGIIYTFE